MVAGMRVRISPDHPALYGQALLHLAPVRRLGPGGLGDVAGPWRVPANQPTSRSIMVPDHTRIFYRGHSTALNCPHETRVLCSYRALEAGGCTAIDSIDPTNQWVDPH